MLFEVILRKRGVRTDRIWTHPLIYKSILKLIPLFLDTWALMHSQYWPRQKLNTLRDDRVRELMRDARAVPYWNEKLSRIDGMATASAPELLADVPITAKSELNQRPLEQIAVQSLISRSDADHTSGSTGKPFNFFQDWHASLRSFAVTERVFRTIGTPGWLIARRPPVVYMRSRERNGFTFFRHVWFFLRAFTSIQYRMDDLVALGKQLKHGFILYGYTSWVVEVARQMDRRGISLPIKKVMVAGEHLSEPDRDLIERVMQAELYTMYASRETGFLAFECEQHVMHISEEWAYLEVVDAAGKRVPNGTEGRILVTTFDNRVMPFIRYEIGDIGIISDTPCPCGRSLQTLEFKGRTAELMYLEDNRVVSLLDISYAMGHVRNTVRQYQIIQTSLSTFVIKVIPGPDFAEKKEELAQILIRLLHPRVQIVWEPTERIAEASSGKAVYFIRDFSYRS